MFDSACAEDFLIFIRERHNIYEKKSQGLPAPWTSDPILQKYKFCNVYRELDKTTMWIATNWRNPHKDDPDVWFSMAVARYINKINSLERFPYPLPWDKDGMLKIAEQIKMEKRAFTSSAYRIGFTASKGMKKAESIIKFLDHLYTQEEKLRPREKENLEDFFKRLLTVSGIGSFMAGQIIADTKYTSLLQNAPDWWTWAASGPGSRRGLYRIIGTYSQKDFNKEVVYLQEFVNKALQSGSMAQLHAQDIQNCLCEFDKYERTRLNQGRPKSVYIPGRKET